MADHVEDAAASAKTVVQAAATEASAVVKEAAAEVGRMQGVDNAHAQGVVQAAATEASAVIKQAAAEVGRVQTSDTAAARLIVEAAERAATRVVEEARIYGEKQAGDIRKVVERLSMDVDKLRGTLTMFAPKPDVQFQLDQRIARMERETLERVRDAERTTNKWRYRYFPALIVFVLATSTYAAVDRHNLRQHDHTQDREIARITSGH